MRAAFTSGFRSEILKVAFGRGFVTGIEDGMEKGALPFLIPLLAAGLVGGAALGLGAASKPKDVTWRSWMPPKDVAKTFGHMAGLALPAKASIPLGIGMSMMDSPKAPLAYRPPSVSATPISQLAKRMPGGF